MRKSSDNPFSDPRHSDAGYLIAKADMTNIIRSTMRSRNWSIQDVADKAGLDPLLVEKIYIYRLNDYSLEEINLVFSAVRIVEPDLYE